MSADFMLWLVVAVLSWQVFKMKICIFQLKVAVGTIAEETGTVTRLEAKMAAEKLLKALQK